MRKVITIGLFLICSIAIAQNNTWQPFQPQKRNVTSVGAPTPQFRVLSDGSITPTIGTAGTYTRSGTFWRSPTSTTLTQVGANVTTAPSFPYGYVFSNTATTLGGYWPTSAITNLLIRSSEFDNATWVKNGTASITANNTTDPEGTSTADRLIGAAVGDGVQQASASAAGSSTFLCGAWLNISASSKTVDFILKDQAGSPQSTTATRSIIRNYWSFYSVTRTFSAATGNAVCEIKFNNTGGYSLFAYGAGLYGVNFAGTTADLRYDSDMPPTIITTAATASVGAGSLNYAGAELNGSTQNKTFSIWFYSPSYTDAAVYSDKTIGTVEAAAFTRNLAANVSTSTATIQVIYHSSIGSTNTGAVPVKGRWNHLVLSVNGATGDNNTYLNGALVNHNATTWSAWSAVNLIPGGTFSDGSSPTSHWNAPIGWTEFFPNKSVTSTEAAAMYAAQKSGYGL